MDATLEVLPVGGRSRRNRKWADDQFDWSHEVVMISGVTVTVKVAHARFCHSRMMFARAYLPEIEPLSAIDGVDGSRSRHRDVPHWVLSKVTSRGSHP